jgi:hypothetical protein
MKLQTICPNLYRKLSRDVFRPNRVSAADMLRSSAEKVEEARPSKQLITIRIHNNATTSTATQAAGGT